MKHFRIDGEEEVEQSQNNKQQKQSFNQILTKSLGSVLKYLPFVEFTVNYGYAIENIWITMLMIVHQTPSYIDSFVWIVPVIIAVLIRPYIIRYVHQINFKVYREIHIVSFFLIFAATGCFIVGFSCDLQKKSQILSRVFQCSVGWTLMDVGFELVLFFANKIKLSYEQLQAEQIRAKEQEISKQQVISDLPCYNYPLYGLLVGYLVSIAICWIIQGRSIKAFYRCAKYAYFSVGGLSMLAGLRLYSSSKINLPTRLSQEYSTQGQNLLQISHKVAFYLPGYYQFKGSNFQTFCKLIVHFIIVFLNDVIMIYTVMWLTQPNDMEFAKQGEAYKFGLKTGALALIIYTVIDNLKIQHKILQNRLILLTLLPVIASLFLLTNFKYNLAAFILLPSCVAILNQFYRKVILLHESQNNHIFETCIEITERAEKIFVLCIFPFVPLLILNRDDIPDSLIWSSVLAAIAFFAYLLSRLAEKRDSEQQVKSKTVKVNKIQ